MVSAIENMHGITAILVIVCILEMFYPVRTLYHRFIQALLFTIGSLFLLGWRPAVFSVESWEIDVVINTLVVDVVQMQKLFPNIWFILGTWLLYLIAIKCFQFKYFILGTVIITTVTLAAVDTFTQLSFFLEIVIMICSALLLLIMNHFKMLREKSPAGWDHLTYYPETLLVPILIFFGFVLIAAIFLPDTKPVMTDPYTAWKNYTEGESGRISSQQYNVEGVGASGTGNFISGYSRNSRELGGTFQFDYSPVMTVQTSLPYYWKGETRSYYSGRGWESRELEDGYFLEKAFSLSHEGVIELSRDRVYEYSPVDRSLLETREVVQTIQFELNTLLPYPVLFGASSMKKIQIIEEIDLEVAGGVTSWGEHYENDELFSERDFPVLWLPVVEELHYIGDGASFPVIYEVVSEVPIIDEEALREVDFLENAESWERYLQLPDELPDRVVQLAQEISQDAVNPYDQVKAIETYLRETYPYTTTPNESLGESDDFVDRFLFEIKEGYCDYFSTAMVVLTRALDIPARWVKGFTEGTRQDDMIEFYYEAGNNMGPGTYIVNNANAHSWVEVYFEGYGWIPFEPTPPFSVPVIIGEREVEDAVELEENVSGNVINGEKDPIIPLIPTLLILLFLSISAIALGYYGRKIDYKWPWKKRTYQPSNGELIIIHMENLLEVGQRNGFKVLDHETLKETFERWSVQEPALVGGIDEVVALFEKASYSSESISSQELERAKKKIVEVEQVLTSS